MSENNVIARADADAIANEFGFMSLVLDYSPPVVVIERDAKQRYGRIDDAPGVAYAEISSTGFRHERSDHRH